MLTLKGPKTIRLLLNHPLKISFLIAIYTVCIISLVGASVKKYKTAECLNNLYCSCHGCVEIF